MGRFLLRRDSATTGDHAFDGCDQGDGLDLAGHVSASLFGVEAGDFPEAGQEPFAGLVEAALFLHGTLGGKPGQVHVLVDKLLFRFTGPKRWDVTVFQFPQPEIEGEGDAYPALDFAGNRVDMKLLRPLMYRNFVKRTIILPGETFYISGGDIYLKQPDGTIKEITILQVFEGMGAHAAGKINDAELEALQGDLEGLEDLDI